MRGAPIAWAAIMSLISSVGANACTRLTAVNISRLRTSWDMPVGNQPVFTIASIKVLWEPVAPRSADDAQIRGIGLVHGDHYPLGGSAVRLPCHVRLHAEIGCRRCAETLHEAGINHAPALPAEAVALGPAPQRMRRHGNDPFRR